jgi:hypothetical protein
MRDMRYEQHWVAIKLQPDFLKSLLHYHIAFVKEWD